MKYETKINEQKNTINKLKQSIDNKKIEIRISNNDYGVFLYNIEKN